jgi:hypothetical protein
VQPIHGNAPYMRLEPDRISEILVEVHWRSDHHAWNAACRSHKRSCGGYRPRNKKAGRCEF